MKKTSTFRVGLLIERSRAFGRELCEGVITFAQARSDWELHFLNAADLQKTGVRTSLDGFIARITTDAVANILEKTGKPVVDLYYNTLRFGFAIVKTRHEVVGRLAAEHFLDRRFKDFINVMFTQTFVDKTGIKTIEELVEKQQPVRLIIKKNGSFGELAAERVFGVFGVDINNPPSWLTVEKTSGGAIKDGLSDDNYDLTIDHIGAGQANTTELCLNHAMIDVQLSDETLAALCEQGYDYVTVPANTWKGQEVEIKTVGSQQCIIVSAEMDEEVAYQITKALCENRDILVNTSAVLANFNPEVAGSKALTGCELHPGAARYYEEMGYASN